MTGVGVGVGVYGRSQYAALRSLVGNPNFYSFGIDSATPVTQTRASTNALSYVTGAVLGTNALDTIDVVVAGKTLRHYLVQNARTNLLVRSQAFDNASWSKVDTTITADATTAPDGTVTADLFTEGVAGTANTGQSITITAGNFVNVSMYVKAGTVTWVFLSLRSDAGANGFRAWFNVSTGVVGSQTVVGTGTATNLSIARAANGFFRIMASGKVDSAATTASVQINSATGDASTTRLASATYYCWQADAIAGASAQYSTSPIPTISATVTRAAERARCLFTGLPGGALAQVGELFTSVIPMEWTGDQDGATAWQVYDGSGGSGYPRAIRTSATQVSVLHNDAGGPQGPSTVTHGFSSRGQTTLGEAWDSASVRAYINGVASGTPDTSLTPPFTSTTDIDIGSNGGTIRHVFGYVAMCLLNGQIASGAQRAALHSAIRAKNPAGQLIL